VSEWVAQSAHVAPANDAVRDGVGLDRVVLFSDAVFGSSSRC
jgi:hypothetical protein